MKNIFFFFGILLFFGLHQPLSFAEDQTKKIGFLENECPPSDLSSGEKINKYTFYTDYHEYKKIFDESKDMNSALSQVQEMYHPRINKRFNEEITKIKQLTEDAYQEKNLPEKSKNIKAQTDSLLFTRELTQRLREYQCILYQYRNNPQFVASTGELLSGSAPKLFALENVFDVEMEKADNTLIISLRMYAQMRMYYAIHLKLQMIIQDLIDEKNALRDFVGIVLNIPAKFTNSGSKVPLQ